MRIQTYAWCVYTFKFFHIIPSSSKHANMNECLYSCEDFIIEILRYGDSFFSLYLIWNVLWRDGSSWVRFKNTHAFWSFKWSSLFHWKAKEPQSIQGERGRQKSHPLPTSRFAWISKGDAHVTALKDKIWEQYLSLCFGGPFYSSVRMFLPRDA